MADTQATPRRPYAEIVGERREVVRDKLDKIFSSGPTRLVWEIGAGHGHFLAAYAAAHRDRLCIGVDIESSRVERATKKRDRGQLTNLHFIRAEARLFLQALPATVRITDIFILFPDPWPKSRHHKHRLLQAGFLRAVAAHATPDCRLNFRTDHHEYFVEARAAVAASEDWRLVDEPWPFEFTTVFQSRAPTFDSFVARRAVK